MSNDINYILSQFVLQGAVPILEHYTRSTENGRRTDTLTHCPKTYIMIVYYDRDQFQTRVMIIDTPTDQNYIMGALT